MSDIANAARSPVEHAQVRAGGPRDEGPARRDRGQPGPPVRRPRRSEDPAPRGPPPAPRDRGGVASASSPSASTTPNSTLQVQPFAAPRSSGLWHEIREQITRADPASGRNDDAARRDLSVRSSSPQIPVAAPAHPGATRLARFVGVDGPRWFLRGVIAGRCGQPDAAAAVEDLFRSIVVVRGTTPMPPRDLIPLRMPVGPAGSTTSV